MDEKQINTEVIQPVKEEYNVINDYAEKTFWASLKTKIGLGGWSLGFLPCLTLFLVVCKVIGLIDLSFIVVFAPLWAPAIYVLIKKYRESKVVPVVTPVEVPVATTDTPVINPPDPPKTA